MSTNGAHKAGSSAIFGSLRLLVGLCSAPGHPIRNGQCVGNMLELLRFRALSGALSLDPKSRVSSSQKFVIVA